MFPIQVYLFVVVVTVRLCFGTFVAFCWSYQIKRESGRSGLFCGIKLPYQVINGIDLFGQLYIFLIKGARVWVTSRRVKFNNCQSNEEFQEGLLVEYSFFGIPLLLGLDLQIYP